MIIIIRRKRVYCNCRRIALYEALVNESTAVSQVFCLKNKCSVTPLPSPRPISCSENPSYPLEKTCKYSRQRLAGSAFKFWNKFGVCVRSAYFLITKQKSELLKIPMNDIHLFSSFKDHCRWSPIGIRDLHYLKLRIRDFKAKSGRDSALKVCRG